MWAVRGHVDMLDGAGLSFPSLRGPRCHGVRGPDLEPVDEPPLP